MTTTADRICQQRCKDTLLLLPSENEESVGELSVDGVDNPAQKWPMNEAPLVFLSHTGRDGVKDSIARPTFWFLTQVLQVQAFFDADSLHPGDQVTEALMASAYKCTHALLLLSPSFRKRKFCVMELNTFMARFRGKDGIRVLPALWSMPDLDGYHPDLDQLIWISGGGEHSSSDSYLVRTLWPALIRELGISEMTTSTLEDHLSRYIDIHRGQYLIPESLEIFARRHKDTHRRRRFEFLFLQWLLADRRKIAASLLYFGFLFYAFKNTFDTMERVDAICKANSVDQSRYATCISIMGPHSDMWFLGGDWPRFRHKWTDRPFCLLLPALNASAITFPDEFVSNPNFLLAEIGRTWTHTRSAMTDIDSWYSVCKLDKRKAEGSRAVILYVDSWWNLTAQPSRDLFVQETIANDFSITTTKASRKPTFYGPCMQTEEVEQKKLSSVADESNLIMWLVLIAGLVFIGCLAIRAYKTNLPSEHAELAPLNGLEPEEANSEAVKAEPEEANSRALELATVS